LNDGAMKAWLAYDWPGNVRELENCLERACAFSSGPMIQVGDLPSAIHECQDTLSPRATVRPKFCLWRNWRSKPSWGRLRN
jgi:two-component system response regulator HydG